MINLRFVPLASSALDSAVVGGAEDETCDNVRHKSQQNLDLYIPGSRNSNLNDCEYSSGKIADKQTYLYSILPGHDNHTAISAAL